MTKNLQLLSVCKTVYFCHCCCNKQLTTYIIVKLIITRYMGDLPPMRARWPGVCAHVGQDAHGRLAQSARLALRHFNGHLVSLWYNSFTTNISIAALNYAHSYAMTI